MSNAFRSALRMAVINGMINAVLAALKITAGVFSNSKAMISDGLHSVTDVIGTVVVIIGILLSGHRPDSRHPYGCERLECVAAVIVSIVIGVTGAGIMISAVTVFTQSDAETGVVGTAALWTAVLSIVVKEIMYRCTKRCARRSGSSALEADAWHQRADALSSVGSLIGVAGARCGMEYLDPLASMVIAVLIIRSAVGIFADAMRKMTDRACDAETEMLITRIASSCIGVLAVDEIKTRLFGNRVFAEITVGVDGTITCEEAYHIAQQINVRVTEAAQTIKACSVHIHPL